MSGDRDRTLEQALTHELRAAGTPDREACVDAETLGAWADGGLDAAQMTSVELHVSRCARCQSMAGAFARSAPAAPSPETSGAFSFWRWWLAPLAATAAAVTLWMVVPEQRRLVVTPPPATAPAQETFARSQPKEQPSPTAPAPAKPAEEQGALPTALQRATLLRRRRDDRRERSAALRDERSAPRREETGRGRAETRAGHDRRNRHGRRPAAPACSAAAPPRPRVPRPRGNFERARVLRLRPSRSCRQIHRGDGASSMARSSAAKTAARRGSPFNPGPVNPSPAARRRRDRSAG